MHIDFYYDFMSPYSYIASKLIQKQQWFNCVRYKPVSLPIIMTKSGNKAPASVPAKATWIEHDLERIAYINKFRIKLPKPFPFSTKFLNAAVASLKSSEANEEEKIRQIATELIYDKVYGDGHFENNTSEFVEKLLMEGAGIVLDKNWTENGLNAVKRNSEEALEKGAFGVPTFILYKDGGEDKEKLFWGSDRIDQVSSFINFHSKF